MLTIINLKNLQFFHISVNLAHCEEGVGRVKEFIKSKKCNWSDIVWKFLNIKWPLLFCASIIPFWVVKPPSHKNPQKSFTSILFLWSKSKFICSTMVAKVSFFEIITDFTYFKVYFLIKIVYIYMFIC
jgi:hypothetical protein